VFCSQICLPRRGYEELGRENYAQTGISD
jgi:hypothetical protein